MLKFFVFFCPARRVVVVSKARPAVESIIAVHLRKCHQRPVYRIAISEVKMKKHIL